MDEFVIYLFSTGSINIFPNNTLSKFTNVLSEPLELDGDWTVALSEISYPTNFKLVTNGKITYSDPKKSVGTLSLETKTITAGVYESVESIMDAIIEAEPHGHFDYTIDPISRLLSLNMIEHEILAFPNPEIPNILGVKFEAHHNESYVGTKKGQTKILGDYPVDLLAGRHFIFVYLDIIDYQYVGDTKAPLLRTITTSVRMKNGCINSSQDVRNEAFQNLHFKKLLSHSISSVSVELRNETGDLVPFSGTGSVTLALKFKKFT